MTTEEMLDSFRNREAASATTPAEEVNIDTEAQPFLELDAGTAKAVSAHLLAGLEAGDVIAEGGEMHPLMVTITLEEYRRLVASHVSDTRALSDYYATRREADTAKKELAEAKKRIDSLTQQLIDVAMKGGAQ